MELKYEVYLIIEYGRFIAFLILLIIPYFLDLIFALSNEIRKSLVIKNLVFLSLCLKN